MMVYGKHVTGSTNGPEFVCLMFAEDYPDSAVLNAIKIVRSHGDLMVGISHLLHVGKTHPSIEVCHAASEAAQFMLSQWTYRIERKKS